MVEILPAILEKTFEGVREKAERLSGVVSRAQLDIADGIFVPEKTWNQPERLRELAGELQFEAHLMVDRPEKWVERWARESGFRITFHHEATYDVRRTIGLIRSTGKEVGIALNLDTPVSALYDILKEIDAALIMGVDPGAQGREFNAKAVDKVRELRARNSEIIIAADGGVGPLEAASLLEAGANVLVSGSYVFGQEDIKQAIISLGGA